MDDDDDCTFQFFSLSRFSFFSNVFSAPFEVCSSSQQKARARERDESRVGERAHPRSSSEFPHRRRRHALRSVESLLHRTRGTHRARMFEGVEISLPGGMHHLASKASFRGKDDDDEERVVPFFSFGESARDDDVIDARRQTREEYFLRRKQLEQ